MFSWVEWFHCNNCLPVACQFHLFYPSDTTLVELLLLFCYDVIIFAIILKCNILLQHLEAPRSRLNMSVFLFITYTASRWMKGSLSDRFYMRWRRSCCPSSCFVSTFYWIGAEPLIVFFFFVVVAPRVHCNSWRCILYSWAFQRFNTSHLQSRCCHFGLLGNYSKWPCVHVLAVWSAALQVHGPLYF